jgi:hypothetical protein
MRRLGKRFGRVLIPLALGVVWVAGMSAGMPSTAQADEGKIDVTITDKGYTVDGHTTPGAITKIILHNKGTMTHGFSSRIMKDTPVRVEGDGKEVMAYGVKSIHVDAGKTATLIFSKPSKHDPATGISETQQYGLWCDIHPHMRGEFLILETKGEVGGG